MKFFISPRHRRIVRWLTPGSATALLFLAAGCATPGTPHPPSLKLPVLVKDLTAERIGDAVELHWTTPTKTTDSLNLTGPLTAEICRTVASAPSSPCTAVRRLAVQPGPSQTSETLPAALTTDPATLLAYRVQIFNAAGHSAGLSQEAFAAAGAAPPPVGPLHATPVRTGAMLEWRQQDTTAFMELVRFIDGAPAPTPKPAKPAPKAKTKPKPTPPPTSPQTPAPKSQKSTPSAPAEVKLKTPTQTPDAGGTLDPTALRGQTYRYTAQRVRTVVLSGHSLEIRSLVSAPVVVLLRDTFPPQAPSALTAVPGGAAESSIDLSWEPNTDPDLAGYNIYRQEVTSTGTLSGTASRLNPTPIVGPAYRDQTAVPGRRYAYRVTAVDTTGNESAPSADVQETLREQ